MTAPTQRPLPFVVYFKEDEVGAKAMLGVQKCIGGRSEWENMERMQNLSVQSVGQEMVDVGGELVECDVYQITSKAGVEKLWALLGPKSTFLVGETRMAEAAGSILPSDLAKRDRIELALPSLEIAAPLLQAGFSVSSTAKKGGGMAVSVEVPREKLFELFQAVSDAGLGFNGLELRKP